MNDSKAAAKSHSRLRHLRHLRPRSLNYYLKVTKARKKIGTIATRGFFQMRELLLREVPLTASDINESFTGFLNMPHTGYMPKGLDIEELENTKTQQEKNNHKNDDDSFKEDDLDTIIKNSNEVLAEATTIFPFTLFPDTITVDRTKLTITQRTFFRSSKVTTIHIEDVLNIAANVGPFFGSLIIAIKGLTSQDHYTMNYFKRSDAIHLKHIIQGHMIAQHDKIDYRHLEHEKLIDTLIKLGHDSNT